MLKKFRITVDGKIHSVTVEEITVDGGSASVTSTVSAVAATPQPLTVVSAPVVGTFKSVASGSNDIPSPLGGVVKEVKVSVGQRIVEGDIVIVLEAMKMKTNVFSNFTGVVSAVYVKLEDAVDSGQALITVG